VQIVYHPEVRTVSKTALERIGASTAARAVAFALAYFAAVELGRVLSIDANDFPFPTVRPAAGLLLATLALSEYGWWSTLLLTACGAHLVSDVVLHGRPMEMSIGFWVAGCAQASTGAWLLRRFVGMPVTLASIKEVLGLACLPALVSGALGAAVGAGVARVCFGVSFLSAWRSWWLADAIGVLVTAPLVFTLAARRAGSLTPFRPWRIVEAATLLTGMFVVAQGVFGELLPVPFTVPIFVLPFLLWAALRFGPAGAATAIILVATIGGWNTSHGRGPYARLTRLPSQQVLRAQGALGVASLSVLILSAAVAERKHAEQKRIALIQELEKALQEIKTLRGLIPLCAWCKNIRDDQGFWLRLEDYLRTHTDAEFTHGICPQCLGQELDTAGSGAEFLEASEA
jgi:integral membrane sensor domain MASE1